MRCPSLSKLKTLLSVFTAYFFLILSACSPQFTDKNRDYSSPLVTDVIHTTAKRQSIGNCWIYATATWLESLLKEESQQDIDISESYWTWWHFYEQVLADKSADEVDTAGDFSQAGSIILNHGFVTEGEFIPKEDQQEMSIRQSAALAFMNQSLKDGELRLAEDRTPELVRQELDQAFETNMNQTESLARLASEVTFPQSNQNRTLRDILNYGSPSSWRNVHFPQVWGQDTVADEQTIRARRRVWKRVFRALNDHKPVIISLMVDFNGLDNLDGTFKGNLLKKLGVGRQGGHLTVLKDYSVTNVPGIGVIGYGDMSREIKDRALEGTLDSLVVKNSWGANRPERGIKDGLTYFDRNYLEGQFAWKLDEEDPESSVDWYTSLNGFILPPGY